MTVLAILQEGDPMLRRVSLPVEPEDLPELSRLADDMVQTMSAAAGVGLAAVQVGRLVRMIAVNFGNHTSVICNPVIIARSGKQTVNEGCLSVDRSKWGARIERALRIRLTYLAGDGTIKSLRVKGLTAAIIQHEVDHLNGILFVDLA